MNDFLFDLVTVGFPVTGATFVLIIYIISRYKERSFLIETGKEIPNDSRVYPFSIVTILKEAK